MRIKSNDKADQIWIPETIRIFVFMEWCVQDGYDCFISVYDNYIRAEELSQSILTSNMILLFEFIISSEIS